MIESFTITNGLNESYVLPLRGPSSQGLLITSVTGLGPVNANINSDDMAIGDGSIVNSSRISSRNIVFSIKFATFDRSYNDFTTIESVRRKTYSIFPVKEKISIVIKTVDNKRVKEYYIDGYVETNEPDIFSDKEGCQVSVICPDPYFYDIDSTRLSQSSVTPLFHFPYSNESINEPKTVFGFLDNTYNYIRFDSSVDIGFEIRVRFHDNGTRLIVTCADNEDFISPEVLKIDHYYLAESEVSICTEKNKKRATYTLSNDVETTILDGLVVEESTWLKLHHGDNYIKVTAVSENTGLETSSIVSYEILYRTKYIGV